eukprot:GHRR01031553.1.p3 GENE.GHRR01031553.1~~GHRR01031553.1.p3  ORF type:complete len:104 (+),score=16.76 GHRR01031553.1:405-716(+)
MLMLQKPGLAASKFCKRLQGLQSAMQEQTAGAQKQTANTQCQQGSLYPFTAMQILSQGRYMCICVSIYLLHKSSMAQLFCWVPLHPHDCVCMVHKRMQAAACC